MAKRRSVEQKTGVSKLREHNIIVNETSDVVTVYANKGATINIGNFESVRFDYGVGMSVNRANLERGFELAKKIVSNQLDKSIEETEGKKEEE